MDQTKGELTKVVTVQITTIQRASEDDIKDMRLDDLDTRAYEESIKYALCADDVKVVGKQYFVLDAEGKRQEA